jgi:CRISPR locus-related DNA-binding protein
MSLDIPNFVCNNMIHIALIGKTKEPVLEGFRHYGNISKLYLIHSKNDIQFRFENLARDVKISLGKIGFSDVILVRIDPFDMNDVVEKILNIIKNEFETCIINVTGGTNLMAAAASAAAFISGSEAYYVLDRNKTKLKNLIVELPIPKIPYANTLQKTQIIILKKINEYDGHVSNTLIRQSLNLSPQKLSYHITELEKKNLIKIKNGWEYINDKGKKTIDKRKIVIDLTNSGKLLSNYTVLF